MQPTLNLDTGDALIDGPYRYILQRKWDVSKGNVIFLMLNPSVADAVHDDPTLRRCMHFARSFGYGQLTIVNLFAYIATKPKSLRDAREAGIDIVGPRNDACIKFLTHEVDVICAWGATAFQHRAAFVVRYLREHCRANLLCLGITKDGHPKHPLYLANDTQLEPFTWAENHSTP